MLLVELLLFFHQSVGSIVPANFVEPQYLQEYLVWNNQFLEDQNRCYNCTNLVFTDIFHKSCDSLLFAIVILFSVGCQQRPTVLTLSSPFSFHGRTISCASVSTSSKMLGWFKHHFLNGNPALASSAVKSS